MSSSNSAFNLQGAIPKTSIGGSSTPSTLGISPISNALNSAKSNPFTVGALAPKPYTPPVPSTPVKKITSADGTMTEFHAPQSGVLSSSSAQKTDSGTGQNIVTGNFPPGTPQNAGGNGELSQNAITGNTTTPSGATVNATTGQMISNPNAPTNPTYSGATAGLLNIGQNATSNIDQARQQLAKQIGIDQDTIANTYKQAIPINFKQGQAQVEQQAQAQKEAKLEGILSNYLTGQGQQISALGNAGSLSTATSPFGQYSYGQQGAVGANAGGSGGLTYNPNTDASNFADKVLNGQLSYSDAVSALGYAGSIGAGLLQSAITSKGGNLPQIEAQTSARQTGVSGNAIDTQAINGAQNNINSITQLINNSNLNSKGINLENATIQALQSNLSNPDYQTLKNALLSIDNALSQVTGTPVDIAQLSTTQGTSLLATINNQVQLAKGIAAGKLSGNNTQSNATTNSGSIYDF